MDIPESAADMDPAGRCLRRNRVRNRLPAASRKPLSRTKTDAFYPLATNFPASLTFDLIRKVTGRALARIGVLARARQEYCNSHLETKFWAAC